MTAYQKVKPSYDGSTVVTFQAAAAGDTIVNAQGGVLMVRTGATGTTLTIVTPGTLPNGDPYPDKAIVIPTTAERWIPIGPEYCDANGVCTLSWSSLPTVTWAVATLT